MSENTSPVAAEEVSAPVEAAPPAPEQRKPNKFEQKQMQKYAERVRRHMAKGLTLEQAQQIMAREDYESLSPDKKIRRLEAMITSVVQRFEQDINNLRHNDGVIGDALDVNFRAFAKILLKLGVGLDEQKALIEEARQEVEASIKAEQEKREAQARVAAEAQKAREEAAAIAASDEAPAEPQDTAPEGATEFSG